MNKLVNLKVNYKSTIHFFQIKRTPVVVQNVFFLLAKSTKILDKPMFLYVSRSHLNWSARLTSADISHQLVLDGAQGLRVFSVKNTNWWVGDGLEFFLVSRGSNSDGVDRDTLPGKGS